MSSSDESRMFSLSALTQNASRPSRPPRPREEDSGLIDLARLRAEVDQPAPLAFQPPPLFAPEPLTPLALNHPQSERSRRFGPLAAAGAAIVAVVGVLAWLGAKPPPALPAAESVAPTATPLEMPTQSPAPRSALEASPSETSRESEQAPATPESEQPQVSDPPSTLVHPKPTPRPRPKAPTPHAQPQQAPAPARKDPCASCAPGDLRCNMRCRAR